MTANQDERFHSFRSIFSFDYIWFALRTPEAFVIALVVVAAILSLTLVIPQQPANLETVNDFALWVASLPEFYQASAPWLSAVGLVRIFDTWWFWLPMAWLALICLVMLGDYLAIARRYLNQGWSELPGPIPHPLSRIITKTIRLPAPAEAGKSAASGQTLMRFQANLQTAAYQCQLDPDQETLVARRRPIGWLGPAVIAAGMLFVLGGLAVQTLWGRSETISAELSSEAPLAVANQLLWLERFTPILGTGDRLLGGEIGGSPGRNQSPTMQLHFPIWREGWWIILADIQPTAYVQLIQDDAPLDTVELRFPNANQPVRFKHPDQNWLFELRYLAQTNQPGYHLEIIRSPSGAVEPATLVQTGAVFSIADSGLAGQITIKQRFLFRAYRLPGLWLVVTGLIVLVGGAVLLSQTPVGVVWLKVITKGRGSRIEVEAVFLQTPPPDHDPLHRVLITPTESPARETLNG